MKRLVMQAIGGFLIGFGLAGINVFLGIAWLGLVLVLTSVFWEEK